MNVHAALPLLDSQKCDCAHCGEPFTPRNGSGGKRQIYCSPECKSAARSQPITAPPTDNTNPNGQEPTEVGWTDGRHGADWSRAGSDIAIAGQAAVAVYENEFGATVIRQEGHYHQDEDHWIVVEPQNLRRLIDALSEFLPNGT
jgi:hypothetical protein